MSYKRISDAVLCFSRTNRRLKIVGDGPEYAALKRMAGATVEFCGRVPDCELRDLYARCRAVVIPGEEDFGIVAVEAIASGRPVIALGKGGVLETAPERDPRAGFFYSDPTEHGLERAVEAFERAEPTLKPNLIRSCAGRFSEERFRHEISKLLFSDPPTHPESDLAAGVAQPLSSSRSARLQSLHKPVTTAHRFKR